MPYIGIVEINSLSNSMPAKTALITSDLSLMNQKRIQYLYRYESAALRRLRRCEMNLLNEQEEINNMEKAEILKLFNEWRQETLSNKGKASRVSNSEAFIAGFASREKGLIKSSHIIGRIYNYKFGQADSNKTLKDESDSVQDVIHALATTFGDAGWCDGGAMGALIYFIVNELIGPNDLDSILND